MSVIIPSKGRPTLQRAIDSCDGADEVLVDVNEDDDLGYAARTRLIAQATGTHLVFLDDDDVYTPGAIDLFRTYAELEPDRVHIFKMRYAGPGGTLWHERVVRHGNIGSPMLLVPNVPGKLGEWRHHTGGFSGGGDYVFCAETVGLQGPPVWVPEVVAIIRP